MGSRKVQAKTWRMFFWSFLGIVVMLLLNFRRPYGIGEWIDLSIFISATICFLVLWRLAKRDKLPPLTSPIFPGDKGKEIF